MLLSEFVDIETIAAEAKRSPRTIRRWIYSTADGLPVHKIGSATLVLKADFESWVRSRRVQRNPLNLRKSR